MAVASLTLGIISIALSNNFVVGTATGVLAVVFGAVVKGKGKPREKIAKAGLILGIIGLGLVVLLALLSAFGVIHKHDEACHHFGGLLRLHDTFEFNF